MASAQRPLRGEPSNLDSSVVKSARLDSSQEQQKKPPNSVNDSQSGSAPSLRPSSPLLAHPVQQQFDAELPQKKQPAYPWSARPLTLLPPTVFSRPGTVPPTSPSPSPFPRYGHSLPATGNAKGDLYLFGGLMRDSLRNDLYLFQLREYAATLVQTIGDIPSPRVGHASSLVNNVLIVWGGDTKMQPTKVSPVEMLDNELYLLNLVTRAWTGVRAHGSAPIGRYGHAVAISGSRFLVFGGQANQEFFNDLWAFDLNSLRTRASWELYEPTTADMPPRRTGCICIAYDNRIIIFGGTDGQYHYNDTWAFDLQTRRWSELECIGFIPSPREGHTAAIVDDVIYIFGGRGVDGKDLGDLRAFKISNVRWYMFENMGSTPSKRSGHAMASVGSKVVVLGGESFSPIMDDPDIIHVLQTKNIKYPISGIENRSKTLTDDTEKPSESNGDPDWMRTTSANKAPNCEENDDPESEADRSELRSSRDIHSLSETADIDLLDMPAGKIPKWRQEPLELIGGPENQTPRTVDTHSQSNLRSHSPTITAEELQQQQMYNARVSSDCEPIFAARLASERIYVADIQAPSRYSGSPDPPNHYRSWYHFLCCR